MAIIYPDKAVNLSELKNQRGVQFSRPEISKQFDRIIKEVINRLIYLRVNGEP